MVAHTADEGVLSGVHLVLDFRVDRLEVHRRVDDFIISGCLVCRQTLASV